jgi:hypothetical protein
LELRESNYGVTIGDVHLNSFAYADDVTVFSSTAIGLQRLIDKCYAYSQKWRFKFGIKKTKCMSIGKIPFVTNPSWSLGTSDICLEDRLEILGTTFSNNGNCNMHVENRVRKCRQSYYGLNKCGMVYPGASSDVKCYLWKSICAPVLMYGLDCLNVNKSNVDKLETTQGNLIKQSMGLSKRVHSTELIASLGISKVCELLQKNTVSLFSRIFKVDTPLRDLTSHFMSLYIDNHVIIPGTIVSTIVSMGLSVIKCAFMGDKPLPRSLSNDNGHIDSIRAMIFHENFIKPYSDEHTLVYLLTKSF